MKFRTREDIVVSLVPFVLGIPVASYRPWAARLGPHELYMLHERVKELEGSGLSTLTDNLYDCVPRLYGFWNQALFQFVMHYAPPSNIKTFLFEAVVSMKCALIAAIYRNANTLGLDLFDDDNGIVLAERCVQQRFIGISDVMVHIPNVKLSDPRWMKLLLRAAEHMSRPADGEFSRPVFNAILQCADVYGDGIQLEGEIDPRLHYVAADLVAKQACQQSNKRAQLAIARCSLQERLPTELLTLIEHYHLSTVFAHQNNNNKKK